MCSIALTNIIITELSGLILGDLTGPSFVPLHCFIRKKWFPLDMRLRSISYCERKKEHVGVTFLCIKWHPIEVCSNINAKINTDPLWSWVLKVVESFSKYFWNQCQFVKKLNVIDIAILFQFMDNFSQFGIESQLLCWIFKISQLI